jgi:hypothetical protein
VKTGRTFGPEILRGIVLLFSLSDKLAGLFQGLAIHYEVDADHVIKPCVEVDTAVCVYRLVCSHLYHVAYLPYGAMNSAYSR